MHLIRVFTNVTETSEYLRDKCLDRATSAAQSVSVTGSKPFSYRLISVNTMLTLYLKHCHHRVHLVTLLVEQCIPETKMRSAKPRFSKMNCYFGDWVSLGASVWAVLVQFWPPTTVLRLCTAKKKQC